MEGGFGRVIVEGREIKEEVVVVGLVRDDGGYGDGVKWMNLKETLRAELIKFMDLLDVREMGR